MHSLLEVGSPIDLLDIKCGTREWGSLTNTMPDLNVISLMKHYEGDYVQRTVLKNWHMRMHACMTWHDALLAASDCCFLGYKLASIYQRWYIVHEVSMLLAVCVQQASMYSRQQARSECHKQAHLKYDCVGSFKDRTMCEINNQLFYKVCERKNVRDNWNAKIRCPVLSFRYQDRAGETLHPRHLNICLTNINESLEFVYGTK